jgi:hypothetical protein
MIPDKKALSRFSFLQLAESAVDTGVARVLAKNTMLLN